MKKSKKVQTIIMQGKELPITSKKINKKNLLDYAIFEYCDEFYNQNDFSENYNDINKDFFTNPIDLSSLNIENNLNIEQNLPLNKNSFLLNHFNNFTKYFFQIISNLQNKIHKTKILN